MTPENPFDIFGKSYSYIAEVRPEEGAREQGEKKVSDQGAALREKMRQNPLGTGAKPVPTPDSQNRPQ